MQRATTGFRGHVIEEKPRIVKDEVAINVTKPGREIGLSRICTGDVNSSIDTRSLERALKCGIDLRGPRDR